MKKRTKEERQTITERLCQCMELPSDMANGSLIEIRGRGSVSICGCRKILHYSREKIELEGKDFVYWANQSDVKAGRARSIMHQLGTDKMVAVRMMGDGLWQGNIVIDFDNVEIDIEAVKSALYDARSNIQYILPEIED